MNEKIIPIVPYQKNDNTGTKIFEQYHITNQFQKNEAKLALEQKTIMDKQDIFTHLFGSDFYTSIKKELFYMFCLSMALVLLINKSK